ncbi:threonylcarbamoyl-AMP synthase [bacterium]|nr:threonylcarbamoyl-AMP synthase [bacterium]
MEVLNIKEDFSKSDLNLIYNNLKNNKIVALPTDTIFGFSSLASKKSIVDKIFLIKKRPKNKTFILLFSSLNMVKKYCIVNSEQGNYLKNVWPGRVTVILKSKKSNSLSYLAKENSFAVRVPDISFLRSIIKKLKEPVISTSANLSGENNINSGEEIYKSWLKEKYKPDLIIFKKEKSDSNKQKKNQLVKPSKIIDLRDINNIKVLRK